jgi:integrase/recombinase XerD
MRTNASSIDDPLFASRGTDRRLTRGAIWRIVTNHAATASRNCRSLAAKHVTPHVLRHTAAMTLLHAGVDLATIALWLGHESIESTNVYLHADMALKERALARTSPLNVRAGRYHASDELLAFLERL